MFKRWLFLGLLLATITALGCSDDVPSTDTGLSDVTDTGSTDLDSADSDATDLDSADTADSDQHGDASDTAGDAANDTGDTSTQDASDTDDAGSQTGTAAASAYEQAALDFIHTYCEAAFDCRHRTEDDDTFANHLTRYDSIADCKADAVTLLLLISADQYKAAIEAGTVAFDAGQAQHCQASLSDEICNGREFDGVCSAALVGQLAQDESCSLSAQCADGLTCKLDDMCTGTCEPFLPESCGDSTCPVGTYCDDTTTSCEPLKAAGEACEETSECDQTTATWCNHDWSAGTAECVPLRTLAQGETCELSEVCQPSLRCDEATQKCAPGGQDGDACVSNDDCDTTQGLGCNSRTDTCTLPGSLGAGDSCDRHAVCAAELACDPRSDVCADILVASGESCAFPFVRCESGRCQDLDATTGQGTCGALRQAGEACLATMQCELGLYCESSSGTCAAVKADGESCSRALDCASLRCLEDGTCGSGSACPAP